MSGLRWIFIKVVVVALAVASMMSYDSRRVNIPIIFAIISSVVFFVVLSAYLYVLQKRDGATLDRSMSVRGQFWPMTKHPFQYWAVASVALILGGMAAALKAQMVQAGNPTLGFTFVLLGIAAGVAVFIQVRRA
jgi:hypothetical protein